MESVLKFFAAVITVAGVISLFGLVIMLLWNFIAPAFAISFFKACAVYVLAQLTLVSLNWHKLMED